MRSTTRLRRRLEAERILVAPGVYDGLTATLARHAGCEAVYLTGAGVAYTTLGQPDLGLLGLAEMAQRVAWVAEAAQVPVIADGDTGFGNAINVMRTVREYERAGAAAIQLEDQVFPKRCGHLAGKEIISAEEMAGKIAAACAARRDPDFVVIARTDALALRGLDEALRRGRLYAQAGADVIFIEAPRTREEMAAIPAAQSKPCLANMVEGGRTPLLSAAELEAMGFRLVIFPNAVTRLVARTAAAAYRHLKGTGDSRPLVDGMMLFDEINRLLGLPELLATAERFAPKE